MAKTQFLGFKKTYCFHNCRDGVEKENVEVREDANVKVVGTSGSDHLTYLSIEIFLTSDHKNIFLERDDMVWGQQSYSYYTPDSPRIFLAFAMS